MKSISDIVRLHYNLERSVRTYPPTCIAELPRRSACHCWPGRGTDVSATGTTSTFPSPTPGTSNPTVFRGGMIRIIIYHGISYLHGTACTCTHGCYCMVCKTRILRTSTRFGVLCKLRIGLWCCLYACTCHTLLVLVVLYYYLCGKSGNCPLISGSLV